jgi:signal transduction histidine kinase/ActR/RegA family two-component response regulator
MSKDVHNLDKQDRFMSQLIHDRFSLLDQVPLGVCILRSDYVVIFWNRCLENWTKISPDSITGQSICEFFPHFQRSLYTNRLAPIFAGGAPTVFSSQLHKHLIPARLSDGKNRIQHTTVTAIPMDGDSFYAMLSIQDVTDLTLQVQEYRQMRDRAVTEAEERKCAQERAEDANRVKDEFLAIVSHELRTPLNPILGWSRLLCAGKLSGAAAQKALETIARNATLQLQLIDDLLDVSRILHGKLSLNWTLVDLALVAHAALDIVRMTAETKAIDIYIKVNGTLNPIQGDETRLQQIVWNLLTNAIKFTTEGGQINIVLGQEGKYTFLSVQDTGQGISPGFLPYVFDSFRQADGSTTRTIGGLGLGLAITRHLVELHGGYIEACSPGTGLGATFTVRLPTPKNTRLLLEKSPNAVDCNQLADLNGVQVLVVDDDGDTRDLIAFLLEDCGAMVTVAASVADAIAILDDSNVDLIVSDLGMPDADGFDFIEYIRKAKTNLRTIPAIALTAYAGETTNQRAIGAGFQKHLVKPVDPNELICVVTQLIQSRLVKTSNLDF